MGSDFFNKKIWQLWIITADGEGGEARGDGGEDDEQGSTNRKEIERSTPTPIMTKQEKRKMIRDDNDEDKGEDGRHWQKKLKYHDKEIEEESMKEEKKRPTEDEEKENKEDTEEKKEDSDDLRCAFKEISRPKPEGRGGGFMTN